MRSGNRVIGLVLVALAAACAASSAMRSARDIIEGDERAFGLVIDAGSTGSRLHVFAWNRTTGGNLPRNLSTPVEDAADEMDVKPGISSPGGLDQLATLITHAQQVLAPVKATWGRIPIFLKATAGMRLLPTTQRNAIMTQVRTMLKGSGFQFLSNSQARVISGEEEGVFGWISVNYQQGRLKQGEIHTLTDTVGALDMGGGSTQITFKPVGSPDILANLFPLALGQEVDEDLYTHSFLHFGENEARRRINRLIALNATSTGDVENPCYLSGYAFTYTDPASGRNYTMTGSSNFTGCRGYALQLMDKQATCLTDPAPTPPARGTAGPSNAGGLPPINPGGPSTCSVSGVYQPALNGSEFVAFSGFSYLWDFLQLPLKGCTPAELSAAVASFCSVSWEQAQKEHPSEPAKYLSTFCISGTFMYTLLADGYGFPPDSTAVSVSDPSQGYDWAIGSILYDANAAWRIR